MVRGTHNSNNTNSYLKTLPNFSCQMILMTKKNVEKEPSSGWMLEVLFFFDSRSSPSNSLEQCIFGLLSYTVDYLL